MRFVDAQPAACSALTGSANVVSRTPTGPGVLVRRRGAVACVCVELSEANDGGTSPGTALKGRKRGCGHCPHPGLRIRLYRQRTGPDWGGFRKRGGFSGGAAGSSPTSGTCFPCSGASEPLSVDNCVVKAPSGAFFYWWPVLWPVASLPSWIDGLSFVTSSWAFMARAT
jgi:hypothetical protein